MFTQSFVKVLNFDKTIGINPLKMCIFDLNPTGFIPRLRTVGFDNIVVFCELTFKNFLIKKIVTKPSIYFLKFKS
jgi:hypothetical protein